MRSSIFLILAIAITLVVAEAPKTQHVVTFDYRPPIGAAVKYETRSADQKLVYTDAAAFVVQWQASKHLENVDVTITEPGTHLTLCQNPSETKTGAMRCCSPQYGKKELEWQGDPAKGGGFVLNVSVSVTAASKGSVSLTIDELPPIQSVTNAPDGYQNYSLKLVAAQYGVDAGVVKSMAWTAFHADPNRYVGIVKKQGQEATDVAINYVGIQPQCKSQQLSIEGPGTGSPTVFGPNAYFIASPMKQDAAFDLVLQNKPLDNSDFALPFVTLVGAALAFYFLSVKKRYAKKNVKMVWILLAINVLTSVVALVCDPDISFADGTIGTLFVFFILLPMASVAVFYFSNRNEELSWTNQILMFLQILTLLLGFSILIMLSIGKWEFQTRETFYSAGHVFQIMFLTFALVSSLLMILEVHFVLFPAARENNSTLI